MHHLRIPLRVPLRILLRILLLRILLLRILHGGRSQIESTKITQAQMLQWRILTRILR